MNYSKTIPSTAGSSAFVRRLMKDAPPNSVSQTVHVEREEEELRGLLPADSKDGIEGLLNFDTVSEKVHYTLPDIILYYVI